jgi:hypothetical protein
MEPVTPHRPARLPQDVASQPGLHQPYSPLRLSAPEEVIATPTPRLDTPDSDQPIDWVLQEIRTLEHIANRLDHLYSIRDNLIRRGSRR